MEVAKGEGVDRHRAQAVAVQRLLQLGSAGLDLFRRPAREAQAHREPAGGAEALLEGGDRAFERGEHVVQPLARVDVHRVAERDPFVARPDQEHGAHSTHEYGAR
ncbi:MAG: hypothetical protein ACYTGK_20870 [Planctomycetota bacterium]